MIKVVAGASTGCGRMIPAPLVEPFGIALGGSELLGALIGSGGGGPCAPAVPQQSVSLQSSRWNQLRSRASSPWPQPSSQQSWCAGGGGGGAGLGHGSQQSSWRWNKA